MKKIITLTALFFAILTGANAQNQFADYVNYLKDSSEIIHLDLPNRAKILPHEWRMFPRPESVRKTHNKVIVTFDRKQWEAFHYMHRKMWMRRDEVRKQLNELKK